MTDEPSRIERRGTDVLAVGFAATVAIWTILYVAAMPPGHRALWTVAAIAIAACLFGAGFVLGRCAGRGGMGGAGVGVLISGINLLVLLSLVGGGEAIGPALQWIGELLAVAVVLGAAGAAIGRGRGTRVPSDVNWTAALAWVTTITTLLMLIAGGIVTGLEAGLAVEGWLVAEGHLLVLFPISLMQRDVSTFAEHAHRLWGLLVGLTTIVLAVQLWTTDPRRWIRWLAIAIVAGVAIQGTLGGTRVTEESTALAIAHGVFAQVILAGLAVIAAACGTAWRSGQPPSERSARTDRTLAVVLLLAICVQVTLGTLYRHLQPVPDMPDGALIGLLHGHSFVGSLLVTILAILCGARAWGVYTDQPAIMRAGKALIHTLVLQVALGIASFIVVPKGTRAPDDVITVVEIAFTTAHQATGAALLAIAAVLYASLRRWAD